MKKILFALSIVSLLGAVACNKSEKVRDSGDMNMQREEVRGVHHDGTIEREESMDYQTRDNMGRPVDVEVDEVERRMED